MPLSLRAKIAIGLVLALAAAGVGAALRYGAIRPAAEAPAAPVETAATRDRTRYAHMNEIRIALATYERDYKTHPETLVALVPKYLAVQPTDPATGVPYDYKRDAGGYTLTFTLEVGVFALSAGEHVLTPRGFDIPSLAPERAEAEPPTTVTVIPAEVPPENPLPPPPPEEEIVIDTDGDGLPDDQEPMYGADPTKTDTDGDGLTDYEEAKAWGTDAANPDTDGDGYRDGDEVRAGYDPKGSGKLPAPVL